MNGVTRAARALAQSPGVTLLVLVTLALAIGASATVFGVIDAVLLRPLYRDAGELVLIRNHQSERKVPVSVLDLDDLRATGLFAGAAGAHAISANVTGKYGDHQVSALGVTTDYFEVLGVAAADGRVFQPSDARPGYGEVAVLSQAYFQSRYQGDRRILGSMLRLDEDEYRIVGVMGPGFRHPSEPNAAELDVYLPCGFRKESSDETMDRRGRILTVVARWAPGVSAAVAAGPLGDLYARLRREAPSLYPAAGAFTPTPALAEMLDAAKQTLMPLMAAVNAIVLMACANAASLLLAQGDARRRTYAIASALGAPPRRVAGQLLAECLVLAGAAGLLGVLLALGATELLVAYAPRTLPRLSEAHVGGRVMGYTLSLSLATGLLSGLAPALQAAFTPPQEVLKEIEGAPPHMAAAARGSFVSWWASNLLLRW